MVFRKLLKKRRRRNQKTSTDNLSLQDLLQKLQAESLHPSHGRQLHTAIVVLAVATGSPKSMDGAHRTARAVALPRILPWSTTSQRKHHQPPPYRRRHSFPPTHDYHPEVFRINHHCLPSSPMIYLRYPSYHSVQHHTQSFHQTHIGFPNFLRSQRPYLNYRQVLCRFGPSYKDHL